MKAVVYEGPGRVRIVDFPKPVASEGPFPQSLPPFENGSEGTVQRVADEHHLP